MSASSDKNLRLFAKLEIKHVQLLVNILFRASIHGKQFIQATYNESARYFVETLQVLKDIGWVHEHDSKLSLSSVETLIKALDKEDINRQFLLALISDISPYRSDIANYFSGFNLSESRLSSHPAIPQRLEQSPLRNFFIDIGAVSYKRNEDIYLLEGDALEIYIWALEFRSAISKQTLESEDKRKQELGLAAEIAVLAYEKKRVGQELAHHVEHVSAKNPYSPYDIKSISIHEGREVCRYIEVKAVQSGSYEFYWTQAELKIAQVLKQDYFLYLLPVVTSNEFDLQCMLVIDDPYASIHENPNNWQVEENVIICKKITN